MCICIFTHIYNLVSPNNGTCMYVYECGKSLIGMFFFEDNQLPAHTIYYNHSFPSNMFSQILFNSPPFNLCIHKYIYKTNKQLVKQTAFGCIRNISRYVNRYVFYCVSVTKVYSFYDIGECDIFSSFY